VIIGGEKEIEVVKKEVREEKGRGVKLWEGVYGEERKEGER
jgi:hypothetical protein